MADNAPTTNTPAGPATGNEPLDEIRAGSTAILLFLAFLLIGVAAYYATYAKILGGTRTAAAETWAAGFKSSAVWPVAAWAGAVGLVCLAGGLVVHLRGRGADAAQTTQRLGKLLGVILLTLAGSLLLVLIFLLRSRAEWQQTLGEPLFLWALAAGMALTAGGLATLLQGSQDATTLRLTLMGVGGAFGLVTVLLGFALPIWTFPDAIAGGLEEWRRSWYALFWPALALLGGLVLMFLSLQLGRGMERQNLNIRRLIYGYNAVMTGLLLVAVLALPNVLAYADPFSRVLGRSFDWTKDGVNSISPVLQNVLRNLKEDVTVYLLMAGEDRLEVGQNTYLLMEHAAAAAPSGRFHWRPLSPRDRQNREKILELMKKYSIADPDGMLVVLGKEGEKTDHVFVKFDDLYKRSMDDPMQRGAAKIDYVGENALNNALVSLTEGKTVLYFTQANGEMKLEGAAPPMGGMQRGRNADSLSELKQRLTERRSVEVKPLDLEKEGKVPNDASAVVIVRPTQKFSDRAVKALREYVQREGKVEKKEETVTPGKLMILLSPLILERAGGKSMLATGLEPLLQEYNVKAGDNRILAFNLEDPLDVLAIAPRNAQNPIARAFGGDAGVVRAFLFHNARTVEPAAPEGKGGNKTVETILEVPTRVQEQSVWVETDLGVSPREKIATLRKDRAQLLKVIARDFPSLAVAVSDAGPAPGVPADAAHARLRSEKPRMVVFGAAEWLSDEGLGGPEGFLRVDLFNSCISWLRERASIGETIPPRSRTPYKLKDGPPDRDTLFRLRFVPLGLLVLGVVGLGTGVWVVRRR